MSSWCKSCIWTEHKPGGGEEPEDTDYILCVQSRQSSTVQEQTPRAFLLRRISRSDKGSAPLLSGK